VVIDADGLNALAAARDAPPGGASAARSVEASAWADHLQETRWVLTPHPGEMSRLTGKSTAEVQADRLNTAREGARAWRQVVVLKGAPSITAAPDGQAALNAFANAALATAGSGDVLTGTIAAMLAQGLPPFQAAVSGAYVHALAAELWRARHGAAGLAVSHLAEQLPDALRHLRHLRRSTA
ncbi:MAG TPA: ADP/ATP-dependent (S)-NAD(P)H-hydrate dehydratase, partial [Chloroflexota bacterium]|nr:ADP/ATP-dependent (S)-NAD(P)H-hydrate dehydratase [Chloroflexota bacterium]